MVAVEFTFPANRYHATPWDRHVNEGAVEWPPSPWRILRALVATWYLKARECVPEETVRKLIESLSVELPRYVLPEVVAAAHTRHYMPLFDGKTTKVLDTFLHVAPRGRLVVGWPHAALGEEEKDALAAIVSRIGYLGRAESWVEVRLLPSDESVEFDCVPDEGAEPASTIECERTRLPVPMTSSDFAEWRAEYLRRNAGGRARRKRVTVPETLFDALCLDTSTVRGQKWNRAPGSQWQDYLKPSDTKPVAASYRSVRESIRTPTVARFVLAGGVLPRLTDALWEAERIRTALLQLSDGAPAFTGRTPSGEMRLDHQHAFIVPEACGRHGRISHVTIYAPMGFDAAALAALHKLRKVWQRGRHDIQMVLVGVGSPDDFAGLDLRAGQCPLFVESAVWVSRTPFVATRHEKRRKNGEPKTDSTGFCIGSPPHDLLRLLAEAGFPTQVKIESRANTTLGGRPTRWLSFATRRRNGGGARGSHSGAGFQLTFSEPVKGPILLGYGAHFGLGCFVPPEGVR